ncbi:MULTISPECIES: aldo/keto reductase [Streptomyces]|uniref:aldo/keto reductase n=1 Tax=Streptomyces TaxID=1883 RepID=UPI0022A8BB4D|nr:MULTISPECIES: aldo/keto reductase [Streptomyces]MDX2674064.1 aldo/keto reductase [Streptomyces sp. NRRL_ISP-5395]
MSRSAVDDPDAAGPAPDTPCHSPARTRGVSPQQVCLSWQLAQSSVAVPIPGARRPASVRDSAGAAGLTLSAAGAAGLHL